MMEITTYRTAQQVKTKEGLNKQKSLMTLITVMQVKMLVSCKQKLLKMLISYIQMSLKNISQQQNNKKNIKNESTLNLK